VYEGVYKGVWGYGRIEKKYRGASYLPVTKLLAFYSGDGGLTPVYLNSAPWTSELSLIQRPAPTHDNSIHTRAKVSLYLCKGIIDLIRQRGSSSVTAWSSIIIIEYSAKLFLRISASRRHPQNDNKYARRSSTLVM
jgi:hypothetical protein